MRIVEVLLNVIGWLQIVFATTMLAGLLSLGYYYVTVNPSWVLIGIITGLGCTIGITWATCIWIKYGTVNWLSRIRDIT